MIGFQPSGFSKGSYLNIGASWLWHPGYEWSFSYVRRAGGFIAFETIEQFKPEAERFAKLAGAEAMLLDKKFSSLEDIAAYTKKQVGMFWLNQNPWALYHAAISAGLVGNQKFGRKCFAALIAQNTTFDWMAKIQEEAAILTKLLDEREDFRRAICKNVADKRSTLKLPPLGDTF